MVKKNLSTNLYIKIFSIYPRESFFFATNQRRNRLLMCANRKNTNEIMNKVRQCKQTLYHIQMQFSSDLFFFHFFLVA